MKALQITTPETIQLGEVPKPTLQTGQALVRIQAAAFNRRDYWISVGKYPKIKPSSILGSDGCGIVEEVENEADKHWVGKSVILNPNIQWGDNPAVQAAQYHILGMPTDGTLADYTAVGVDRLLPKPPHLTAEQAATLPLAGLTAYRALFWHGRTKPNDRVLITGVGGGVALFALQFAVAAGAKVWVTSSQEDKIQKAIALGAVGGENYRNENFISRLHDASQGFDVVIDSAGGETLSQLVKIVRSAGRIVFYGATQGLPPSIDLYKMFFRQITLQGSTMGNDQEFRDMIQFVNQHQIIPIVDSVRPFAEATEVLKNMANSSQFGKLVVKMQ